MLSLDVRVVIEPHRTSSESNEVCSNGQVLHVPGFSDCIGGTCCHALVEESILLIAPSPSGKDSKIFGSTN